jgi:hypothetical protein
MPNKIVQCFPEQARFIRADVQENPGAEDEIKQIIDIVGLRMTSVLHFLRNNMQGNWDYLEEMLCVLQQGSFDQKLLEYVFDYYQNNKKLDKSFLNRSREFMMEFAQIKNANFCFQNSVFINWLENLSLEMDKYQKSVQGNYQIFLKSFKKFLGQNISVLNNELPDWESDLTQFTDFVRIWINELLEDSGENLHFGFHDYLKSRLLLLEAKAKIQGKTLLFEEPNGQKLPIIKGRPSDFDEILVNIIENAINHGGKIVEFRYSYNSEKRELVFEIGDNGAGIASELLEKIFEENFTTAKERGGTGKGLFLAKKTVERLKGTITVQSTSGHTIFRVELPNLS